MMAIRFLHSVGNAQRINVGIQLHAVLSALVLFIAGVASAQDPVWTWIKGKEHFDAEGHFGTPGEEHVLNTPPGREHASTWTDLEGNLWMYGGRGYAGSGDTNPGLRDDLWKYNPSTGNWTWVKGHINVINSLPVYGTQGVASPENSPGGREHFITWTGVDGTLWLYGGGTMGSSAHFSRLAGGLWKYDIPTNQWTWVGGADNEYLPVHGTQGQFAPENYPGYRFGASGWTDAAGNLWLFGGMTIRIAVGPTDAAGLPLPHMTNDIWKYDTSLRQWMWLKGANSAITTTSYGMKGVPDSANMPRSRVGAVSWNDNLDNFWFMGGDSNPNVTRSGAQNDIWRYEPATNNWTWMDGSQTPDPLPVAVAQGIADESNAPGGRTYHSGKADAEGNLWIFGGQGQGSTGEGALNDLWKYDTTSGVWTWCLGSLAPSQLGIYGEQGVPTPGSTPGARIGSWSWADASGRFYVMGGAGQGKYGPGLMSDLWRLDGAGAPPPPPPPPPPPSGADLGAVWVLDETKCKTSKKGTKCRHKATLLVMNDGTVDAGKSSIQFFLSADQTLSIDDLELKSKKLGKLKMDRAKSVKLKVKLAEQLAGKYLIAVLDSSGAVVERDETDNVVVSSPLPCSG